MWVMSYVINVASAWAKINHCISLHFFYRFNSDQSGLYKDGSQTPVLCYSVCSVIIIVLVNEKFVIN